jgi:hypothetical protein
VRLRGPGVGRDVDGTRSRTALCLRPAPRVCATASGGIARGWRCRSVCVPVPCSTMSKRHSRPTPACRADPGGFAAGRGNCSLRTLYGVRRLRRDASVGRSVSVDEHDLDGVVPVAQPVPPPVPGWRPRGELSPRPSCRLSGRQAPVKPSHLLLLG